MSSFTGGARGRDPRRSAHPTSGGDREAKAPKPGPYGGSQVSKPNLDLCPRCKQGVKGVGILAHGRRWHRSCWAREKSSWLR